MKKLTFVLSVFLLVGLSFYSLAFADNNKKNDKEKEYGFAKTIISEKNWNSPTEQNISINNGGRVNVSGAKVTSVSSDTINATTTFGSVNFNWAVKLASLNSPIIRRYGGNGTISEVTAGDIISFQGSMVTTSASPIMVNATSIKDWSIQKNVEVRTTLEGQIKSISATTLPTTMVITVGNQDYTINVASNTSILNNNWIGTNLSVFKVGDKVRAYGAITNFTMNSTVVRDLSINS